MIRAAEQIMMNYFKPQGMIPPNAEGGVDIDAAMDHEIARIQAGLGETLIMRDPCIVCTGAFPDNP